MGNGDVEEGTIAPTRWMVDDDNKDLVERTFSNFGLCG